MHRFYIDQIKGETVSLTDAEQLHRIRDVLRLKIDNEISIFDSKGNDYRGVITAIDRKHVDVKVVPVKSTRKTSLKLTVACAIPKGSRMDDIIAHLTQLGGERIISHR